jgi:hypothetical protein
VRGLRVDGAARDEPDAIYDVPLYVEKAKVHPDQPGTVGPACSCCGWRFEESAYPFGGGAAPLKLRSNLSAFSSIKRCVVHKLAVSFTHLMEHLLEVLKIIDGAVNADRTKVVSYAEQLATKVAAAGDDRAAERIRRTARGGRAATLSAARAQPLPVDGESRLDLADEALYTSGDVRVFLEPAVQARVTDFVNCVRASDRLLAHGVGIAPSLLMFGAPGVGKSELARDIAAKLELPLLTARTDALVSSYLGSTSKNLRSLFEHAMSRPCVLFLDEFDAVAKLRDDRHELGELKRVVVSLLQNIDGLDSKTVLLAATNHEHLLDPAIWRRFAFRLQIGFPTDAVRKLMFEHFLGGSAHADINLDGLASASEGLSGADIRSICEDARRVAIVADAGELSVDALLLGVARARIPAFDAMATKQQVAALRRLSPKLFTTRRLSQLLNISTGKVSMLANEAT